MTTYEKIKNLRMKLGMSQSELAELTGYTNRSTITRIERGEIDLPLSKVELFADALNVETSYLLGWEDSSNIIPLSKSRRLPILGSITCGSPTFSEENFEGYFIIDGLVRADFILKAKGDSMINADINDGDFVFIKKTPVAENGAIVAVRIGDDATLKRLVKINDMVILQPENNEYQPIVLDQESDAYIIGEMVGIYKTRNK